MDFLYPHQRKAVDELHSGCILCGGVGSGKSRAAIAYFLYKECGLVDEMVKVKKNLYIITTARKRDSLEWDKECLAFSLSKNEESSAFSIKVCVDSWNNISKYSSVEGAFFIFDEQRVVGSGAWVKNFLKITKNNNWILLSATPGDTWLDYVPVFIANGFFKNRSEFIRNHVVYSRFSKFPKVDHYVNCQTLLKYRRQILVKMDYKKIIVQHEVYLTASFNKPAFEVLFKDRWNAEKQRPISDAGELFLCMRKLVNDDDSRLALVKDIFAKHKKLIVFYNFNFELNKLRSFLELEKISYGEWNGSKHQLIPNTDQWVYLVQYTAGAEGWNCIETDAILFYSLNYSYKIMVQAAGRIDRLNTPYSDLYYYKIVSESYIDRAILNALKSKKDFNEKDAFLQF